MSTRYIMTVICPECGMENEDVYYAPTCGFTHHECVNCGYEVDLAEYTGISYEEASNKEMIEVIIDQFESKMEGDENDKTARPTIEKFG